MNDVLRSLQTIPLDADCLIQTCALPIPLIPNDAEFEALFALHPEAYSELMIHGKAVKMPRWDCAYEKDYLFSNQVASAKKAPASLLVFLEWAKRAIDERLNGLFVNWHDGQLNHYHGKHRDSVQGLVPNTPIVTISLGEERIFRMRPYPGGKPAKDFTLRSGDAIVIPWETNKRFTHEVPKFARYKSKRISVTLRAFT